MSRLLLCVAFFALAVFASAAPLPAGDEAVDLTATVISVREAPAGSALPGVHLEVKINDRMSDVYLAPAGFLDEFGMSFRAGDDVHIVGWRTKVAGTEVVLAQEIAVGALERRTLYLRDNHGPFWDQKTGRQ